MGLTLCESIMLHAKEWMRNILKIVKSTWNGRLFRKFATS